jgi:hypothetical protein
MAADRNRGRHSSESSLIYEGRREGAASCAPVPILEDVSSTVAAGGDFAFAQNGAFVYLSWKGSQETWSISWIDSSGKTQALQRCDRGGSPREFTSSIQPASSAQQCTPRACS